MLRTSLFKSFLGNSFLANVFLVLVVSSSASAIDQACHVRFTCGSNTAEKMKKFADIKYDKCAASERANLSNLLVATAECGTDKRTGAAIAPANIRMVYAFVTEPLDLNLSGKTQVECIKFTRCYPAVGSHWHEPVAYSWTAPAGACTSSESNSALAQYPSNLCKTLTGSQYATSQGSDFNHYLYGPFEARLNSSNSNRSVATEAGVRAAGTH